jgi:tail collar domain
MTEPTTINVALIVPNTGDLVGAWGTSALNANFQAIDGMRGGVASISLSSGTTIALTAPAGALTPGAGPNQQQNACLRFTGTQTGTATIQFTVPGQYIIDNQCTGTTFPIVLAPATGTGTQIGAPPGRKCPVFFDGTNMDYANPPDPGTAIDLHGASVVPPWMTVCTKKYALIKDGTSYSTAAFPGLAAYLGTIFGGSGGSFNVPDESARMRLALDTKGANRVTSGGSGINGASMGAAGGNELAQSHSHTGSGNVSDPQHIHAMPQTVQAFGAGGAIGGGGAGVQTVTQTNSAATGITVPSLNINTSGSGNSQNMPPTIVSFLALIKT